MHQLQKPGFRGQSWISRRIGCALSILAFGGVAAPLAAQAPNRAATATAIDLGNAFSAAAAAARPAVVHIRTETTLRPSFRFELPTTLSDLVREPSAPHTAIGTGTGFIIRSDGYIVTNHHVIHDARRVFVRLFDQRDFEAEIIGVDPMTDLAVLHIDARNLPVALLGNSDRVRVGEWVLAVGNPMGTALTFSVTAGIVSATERGMSDPEAPSHPALEYIQTDAVANRGNSGGPLVDLHGRIVGINSVIASESGYYEGYTLAIPISLALPVVTRLIRYGVVPRAALDLTVGSVSYEDAEAVGLDAPRGAVIQAAGSPGSGARRAGLRLGDVILSIDGTPVASAGALYRDTWFRAAGDTVRLVVARDGGVRLTADVELVAVAGEYHVEGRGPFVSRRGPCPENALEICVEELDETGAAQRGLRRQYAGLEVTAVYTLGPAFSRLVPQHDIITHVNRRRVRTAGDLQRALSDAAPGSIVTIQSYRMAVGRESFARIRLRS